MLWTVSGLRRKGTLDTPFLERLRKGTLDTPFLDLANILIDLRSFVFIRSFDAADVRWFQQILQFVKVCRSVRHTVEMHDAIFVPKSFAVFSLDPCPDEFDSVLSTGQ